MTNVVNQSINNLLKTHDKAVSIHSYLIKKEFKFENLKNHMPRWTCEIPWGKLSKEVTGDWLSTDEIIHYKKHDWWEKKVTQFSRSVLIGGLTVDVQRKWICSYGWTNLEDEGFFVCMLL